MKISFFSKLLVAISFIAMASCGAPGGDSPSGIPSIAIPSSTGGSWSPSAGFNIVGNPLYSLTLTEPSSVEITTNSLEDTTLILLDANDAPIASNDDDLGLPNGNSKIVMMLPAGTYKISVGTFFPSITGDFTLDVALTPFSSAVTLPSVTTGTWVSSNGVSTTGNPAHLFELAAPTTVRVALSSLVADTLIHVIDEAGIIVAQVDNVGVGTIDILAVDLPAGVYSVIAATNAASVVGDYTLEISEVTVTPLTLPVTALSGTWTTSEGPVEGFGGNPLYTFSLTQPTAVVIDLTSAADNTLLLLDADTGAQVDFNQDTLGTNAQIAANLLPGNYKIVAATALTGVADSFTLDVTTAAPAFPAATVGVPVAGNWNPSAGNATIGNPVYQLDIAATTTVTIDLTSASDTYMKLLDATGALITFNDDSPQGGLNSQITRTLAPGSYLIVAGTYSTGVVDSFNLSVSDLPPVIAVGSTVNGNWASSAGSSTIGNPIYQLDIAVTTTVVIDLASPSDTYMSLLDAVGNIIASNDDVIPGVDFNSHLTITLAPGSYQIVAGTFDPGVVDDFTLSVF